MFDTSEDTLTAQQTNWTQLAGTNRHLPCYHCPLPAFPFTPHEFDVYWEEKPTLTRLLTRFIFNCLLLPPLSPYTDSHDEPR